MYMYIYIYIYIYGRVVTLGFLKTPLECGSGVSPFRVLRSCMFTGLTQSRSYFQGVKSRMYTSSFPGNSAQRILVLV